MNERAVWKISGDAPRFAKASRIQERSRISDKCVSADPGVIEGGRFPLGQASRAIRTPQGSGLSIQATDPTQALEHCSVKKKALKPQALKAPGASSER